MTKAPIARVLIIAGSDSGGGAGIQADVKTVTMLGGYAATAITAITAQDTIKVHDVYQLPATVIRHQIDVVLADIGADAIKIGMIGDIATAEVIASVLEENPDIPVVLDPVLVATSGDKLAAADLADFMKETLLPRVTVVTPNIPEAEVLTGLKIETVREQGTAGRALISLGAKVALVKGGHMPSGLVTDKLITPEGSTLFENSRQKSRHTHGTGCTLASALATGIAQGLDIEVATRQAIEYVQAAIRTAPGLGKGHGPLNHGVEVSISSRRDQT